MKILVKLFFVLTGIICAVVVIIVLSQCFCSKKNDIFVLNSKLFCENSNKILKYSMNKNITLDKKNIKINKDGFRDEDFSNKTKEHKILILGSSTTFGGGKSITNEKIFSAIINKILNTKYDVYNMSVAGYNLIQEAENLRVNGLKYNPDIVIVVFSFNDIKPYYTIVSYNNFISNKLVKSKLFRYIYKFFRRFSSENNSAKVYRKYGKIDVSDVDDEEISIKVISNLQKQFKFKCYFFLFPCFEDFNNYNYDNLHLKINKMLNKYDNIKYFDLKNDFVNISRNAKIFVIPKDVFHLNLYGHEVMAKLIYEKLKQDGAIN